MKGMRVWWIAGALALVAAVALFSAGGGAQISAGTSAAQPAGTPPAVQLSLTMSSPEGNRPDPYPAEVNGTINVSGESALDIRFARIPAIVHTRIVGGRFYAAMGPGDWRSLDLAALFAVPQRQAGLATGACRGANQAIGRLLADPRVALGNPAPAAQGEVLDGVTVDDYEGAVSLPVLYDAFAAFFGVSRECAQGLANVFLGSTAVTSPARVLLTLGRDNGFPYRIRFTLPRTNGRVGVIEARLTPSATPFEITAPAR